MKPSSGKPASAGAGMVAMVVACIALACLTLGGCTDDESNPEAPASPITVAWTGFENGDYASAAELFRSVLATDPANAEASEGLAWCLVRLDSLDESLEHFDACLDLAPASPVAEEAWAGQAAASRDVFPPRYAASIESADQALSIAPRFIFGHDGSVTWEDLRLLVAQSSWALADYSRVLAEIDSLGGTPPDPSAPDFHELVLDELERLGNQLN